MTIHLNVTSDLEQKIKKAANQLGLKPDAYIMQVLKRELQNQLAPVRLSPKESQLLKRINASLSTIEWERYRILLGKRDAESLTEDEHAELIAFSDRIEEANARRMKAVAELARLRKTSVPALIESLGLSSAHA